MIVGVPKETKDHEYRVGVIPATAAELVRRGHRVLVERGAGLGAGLADQAYEDAGAELLDSADQVFDRAKLIVKVKEPLAHERTRLKRGQVLFTYLHLAADPSQAEALIASGVTAIAYETVTGPGGTLPLLMPMSEVAGRMAPQVGAYCLEKVTGGRGVLLGGVPGVPPGDVLILGSGTVATNAAIIAIGLGADVIMAGENMEQLRLASARFGSQLRTVFSAADGRDVVPPRRPRHRRSARSRCRRAQARVGGDGEGDEAWCRHRRCFDRPGRHGRDLASHHAFAPNLYRRRGGALLRHQHAGSGGTHLDLRTQQCDGAVGAHHRRQGRWPRAVRAPPPPRGAEHPRRHGYA
jgi:alanine dehydrogenase/PNT-like protein